MAKAGVYNMLVEVLSASGQAAPPAGSEEAFPQPWRGGINRPLPPVQRAAAMRTRPRPFKLTAPPELPKQTEPASTPKQTPTAPDKTARTSKQVPTESPQGEGGTWQTRQKQTIRRRAIINNMLRMQKRSKKPHTEVLDEMTMRLGASDADLAAIAPYWTEHRGDVRGYHMGTPEMGGASQRRRQSWTPQQEAAMQKRVEKVRMKARIARWAANGSPRAQRMLQAIETTGVPGVTEDFARETWPHLSGEPLR